MERRGSWWRGSWWRATRLMEGAWEAAGMGAGGMGGGGLGSRAGWLRGACLRVQHRLHLSLRAFRRLELPHHLDAARLHLAHVLLLVRHGILQRRQLQLVHSPQAERARL